MVRPILYGMEISSVVRGVLLVAKAIDLDLDYREIDLFTGDQYKEDFLKMNPQHSVPTLDDNGQYLWDSHAIAPYLVEKYAESDSLYPRDDAFIRGRINQRLHFDNGILYGTCIKEVVLPIYGRNSPTIAQEVIKDVHKGYGFMETFLETDLYLVGNSLTIADLVCGASISSLFELVPADKAKYPKLHAWFERIEALPYYEEVNRKGNDEYIKMLRDLMEKGRKASE